MTPPPVHPAQAVVSGYPIALNCHHGSLTAEGGIQEGVITPLLSLRHALAQLTPNERLALVGIHRDEASGEFVVETDTGPQRLIPLPLPV